MDGNIITHGFYAREELIYDKNHGINLDAQFSVITMHHAHSGGKTKELKHVHTPQLCHIASCPSWYENMELKQGFRVFKGTSTFELHCMVSILIHNQP